MIKLELSVVPPSVNTMWVNKPNGRYKSEKGKIFTEIAQIELKNQFRYKKLTGDLKVDIRLYFKDNRQRDIDNYNKGILDCMTGIIYKDDSQIIELNNKKFQGCGFNKVEIEIEEII